MADGNSPNTTIRNAVASDRPRSFTPVSNNQRMLQDIRENLNRLNVNSSLAQSTPNLANMFGESSSAVGGTQNSSKKNQRYKGEAMHRIRHSLQPFTCDGSIQVAVNGDVANSSPNKWRSVDVASSHVNDNNKSRLSRLIELGYDKDLAVETLKANPNKGIEVVMEMLNSMTALSGRKSVTKLQPGSLSCSKSSSPNQNGPVLNQSNRSQGIPRSSPAQGATTTQKLFNVLPSHSAGNMSGNWYVGTSGGAYSVVRRSSVDPQKEVVPNTKPSYNINHNGVVLRQRQPDRVKANSTKRWSADYVVPPANMDVSEKRKSMDASRKPPPPYPGGDSPVDSGRFNQATNLNRFGSQDTLNRLSTPEPLRTHSPVTFVYDRLQHRVNVVSVTGMKTSTSTSIPFSHGLSVPNKDPPPYEMIGRGPPVKSAFSAAQPTNNYVSDSRSIGYSTFAAVLPPEANQTQSQSAFTPIDVISSVGNPVCSTSDGTQQGLPPPYPFADAVASKENSRLSSNLDDFDSGIWSSKRTSMATDGSTTQSDSSASTSPTPDSVERSCSPLPVASSPYHTLVIHNNNTLTDKINAEVREQESAGSLRLKNCPPHAFKFYMEQHVENIMKFRRQRDRRQHQLETEMAKVGLSGEAQMEMKKMLHQKESNYIRLKRAKMDKSFFTKIKTLGVGAFGEVDLVRKEGTANGLYAMKTLRKSEVLRRNQVAHVKAERDILAEADNEWVVKLYYSFQDEENLYFVMDYVPGGDMMGLLIRFGVFKEELARFYIAELVLAIESVHKMGFIHRDIKPDNILIDSNGHIKLTDFGLCTGFRWTHDSKYYQVDGHSHTRQASMEPEGGWESLRGQIGCDCDTLRRHYDLYKPLERRAARLHSRCQAHSLVGTPNYIAPEVLMRVPYTQLCDWWSVGVILFEMLIGQPPFLAASPADTQLKVIKWQECLRIPRNVNISKSATDLMYRLLTSQEERIGAGGADEIKCHQFLEPIDWNNGLKQTRAPYVPKIRHATDTSNFDPVPERNGSGSGDRTEDENRILKEGPHHAFYEFTFRRFFDDGGHPYTLNGGSDDSDKWTSKRPQINHPGNKRMAGSVNKSNVVPNKVSAPPLHGILASDDKPPVYV